MTNIYHSSFGDELRQLLGNRWLAAENYFDRSVTTMHYFINFSVPLIKISGS